MASPWAQSDIGILSRTPATTFRHSNRRVYPPTRVCSKKHPLRAHNIGILEQSTIGLAAGLSLAGHFPIVHTIAPFLVERAYEQIKIDLGYQQLGSNLVSVGGSYDYAGLGCTHHCPADVGILNKIPGIEIIVPGHKSFSAIPSREFATVLQVVSSRSKR